MSTNRKIVLTCIAIVALAYGCQKAFKTADDWANRPTEKEISDNMSKVGYR